MRTHRIKFGLTLAAAIAVTLAVVPATAQAQEPPALAAIKDPAEKARVQKLIEGAKKEGALSWIGVQIEPGHAGPILEEFKRYYGLNDLKGEYTYAGTGEVAGATLVLSQTGTSVTGQLSGSESGTLFGQSDGADTVNGYIDTGGVRYQFIGVWSQGGFEIGLFDAAGNVESFMFTAAASFSRCSAAVVWVHATATESP